MTYSEKYSELTALRQEDRKRSDAAAQALAAAKRREVAAIRDQERIVAEARMAEVPWSVIGTGLGITKQAAQQRFGGLF